MNAPANAVSDSRFESHSIADSPTRPTHPFFWSVRRELWENRSIYIVPLAAAGFAILARLLGLIPGLGIWYFQNGGRREPLPVPMELNFIGLLIMGVTFVVAIFYCLDAFYGERRDRTILFWKSLPVSDTTATLAKASIPLIVIPLITFAVAAVTEWIVLAIDAVTGAHASSVGLVFVLQMQAGLLYHLIAGHALWYAPIFAWLLLVSALAPRAPILWAVLPPLFIDILEKIAFHTSYFSRFLKYRFSGGPSSGWGSSMGMGANPISGMSPLHFLASPGLWGGLIVAALFLAAAIQLRRYRAPG